MKKKNIIKIISLLFLFNLYISNVNATNYIATVTDTDGVYIRSGPGTNYSYMTVLNYNKTIDLKSNTPTNTGDSNCSKGWLEVNYNNKTGYICSNCVKITEKTDSTNGNGSNNTDLSTNQMYYTTNSWTTRIGEDYAYVRKSDYGSSTKLDTIYLGTDIKILSGPTNKTSGCSSGWYKVSYYNNKIGYVCGDLIDTYSDITKQDNEYTEILKKAGFPDSYIPYLTYLHSKHPNWIFKADISTKNFDTIVSSETGKNYTQSTYSVYRLSNKLKENPNWYAASSSMTAFMLDPRNYLNEKNIFIFETLSYDKTNHTRNILSSIFSGTYLNTSEDDEEDYIGYFMEAANDYNISPVFLAARVKQEGATNENYDAVSGTSTLTYRNNSLTGYYNFYNIGSYQDSYTSSSVARGLATAAGIVGNYDGTPWNTREKAIKYGAKYIASAYINKGQDTLYYQKFNTKDSAYYSSYTNQYMTNIIAPASESLSVFRAYNTLNLLNLPLTFTIPVYQNMPTNFTSHPPVGNTNNDLSDIKINDTSINGFDSDVLTYDYYVDGKTDNVSLSATASASTSTISGTGTINLTNEETEVKITVTSEIGTTKEYVVTIIKNPIEETDEEATVDEIIQNMDLKLANSYLTYIEVGTTSANIKNTINKDYPNATITITDKNNSLKNDTDNLATGDIITITSGTDTKSYTISIKGDINGDGKINSIDLLRVQKHILNYSTLTGPYKEAADISYDNNINSLDLLRVQKHILKYIKIK